MSAYAVAHMHEVTMGPPIVEYLQRIEQASGWYQSGAYQDIAALRTDNSRSDVILVDGVDPGHRATDVLGPGR